MSNQTCANCTKSELTYKGRKTCIAHVYQNLSPILEDLLAYVVKDPNQINSKVRQIELNEHQREIILLPSYLASKLKNPNPNQDTVTMHAFILKFCQFYLLGLDTRFGICRNCSFVEIDYRVLKLCGCDPQLSNDLKQLNFLFEERERKIAVLKAAEKKPQIVKEPFAIWEKLENMLRVYCGTKSSSIIEINAYYNTNIHKDMWENYDDLTEVILSEPECKSASKVKQIKYDGSNMCYFVLADIKSRKKNSFELKTAESLIPLYQIAFKP